VVALLVALFSGTTKLKAARDALNWPLAAKIGVPVAVSTKRGEGKSYAIRSEAL